MKKIFKKLASMILTAATTLTAINLTPLAQTVSADSWVTGENVNVTCNYFPYTFNFSGSGLTSIFGQFPNMTANGQIAYCSDSLADSGGGGNISRFTVKDNYSDNSPVSLAIAYGYTGRTKYGYSAETEQLATQIVIWCIQDGWYDNSSESTALNYFTANMGNTLASNVKTVYGKIKANMKEYGKVPSFDNKTTIRKMIYNSSTNKWSLTLTDRNGVADQFNWSSILSKYSYLSVSATSDSVTFTSTKAFDTKTLNAIFNNSDFTAIKAVRLIPIAGQTNQQECISYKTSADPPTATVKLYAEESTGDLKIIKTSDDGKVSGITFTVRTTGMTEVGKYTTGSDGEIVIGDLKAGTYVVFETVPQGYENQDAQTITVEPGKTAVVKFNNVLKKGNLKIIKTSEDGNVEGITFRVVDTSTGALETYTTGKNGEILVEDLKPGKYAVVEVVPKGYENQETRYVTVESGKTAEVSFKNVLKKSEIITAASIGGEKAAFTKQNDIITVDDIVSCADLIKGREYIVRGILMNKATGAAFTVNGRPVTAESRFTAGSTSGLVKVSFSFPASAISSKTELVVFESLYCNGVKIAEHSDINDEGQTVKIHVPSISTTASVNGVKDIYSASGTVTIKDTVSYTGLISSSSFAAGVDSEYTLQAVLMDKATGKPYLVNGKQITAEKRFTAAGENGSVDVYLTFDVSGISAKTELVVFESLYFHGSKIAEHSDINDKGQTVTVHAPSIGTIATANGAKEIFSATGTVTIKDTVFYSDLIAGKEYTLQSVLMDKAAGREFTVDGKPVVSSSVFTAEGISGTTEVTFTFDVSEITEKTELVVFESLYYGSLKITGHEDINDRSQTVTVHTPEIGTTASIDGEKDIFPANGKVTLKDTVTYSDLIGGREYTLKGVLMNKAANAPFLVNGKPVEAQAKFIAKTVNGTAEVSFTFDVSGITENTELVVFESLYYGSLKIAGHEDISDRGQTVTVHTPKLETTASSNDEKHAFAVGMVSVKDVVSYSDLITGKEYTVKGTLMNKATGKEFTINGKPVEAAATFIAKNSEGSVEVTFVFDASEITANTTVVAFERLYHNGLEIAAHADINDKDQSVELHKPGAQTTAKVGEDKEVFAFKEIVLEDTVKYSDLIVGKRYTVSGVLMNKATGEAFTVNGEQVTASAEFTAKSANGEVIVTFVFDGSGITQNTDLVVFETVYHNGVEVASHADINDESQTVKVRTPDIGTSAVVSGQTVTAEKEVFGQGEITINDTVTYHDLIVGKEYVVKGVLMDKSTGNYFMTDGNPVFAETVFTAEANDGEVVVSFVFNADEINENTSLVVFEAVYFDGVEIAVHKDIDDEGQTVVLRSPKLETTADVNGDKDVFAVGTVTVTDFVDYHDLIVGKEYTVQGVLMNKATNKPFTVNGEEITAEAAFIAESTDGQVVVTFVFDASDITGNTTVVAFETLYHEGIEVAAHADIYDEGQSIELHKPSISTVATINGAKEIFAVNNVTVNDTVSYTGLVAGREYTVRGILMNKATGLPFLMNGEEVRAETTFVAERTDGEIEVAFTFDASEIKENTQLVVFEGLYSGEGTELAVHADIEDMMQMVTVRPTIPIIEEPPLGAAPPTGFGIAASGLAVFAVTGILAVVLRRKG